MGWKMNLALGAAVLGVGGYLYFNRPTARTEQEDPGPSLTTKLLPRSIWYAKEVRIQRGGLEPMLLSIDHGKKRYMIVDPVKDIASIATLQSIFRIYDGAELLEAWTEEELAADPKKLDTAELASPRATVEVRYPEKTVKIAIGGKGWKAGEVFVRVDDKVYRGAATLLSSIQSNPDDLREKSIFTDLAIGEARKIRLSRRVGGKMVSDAIAMLPNVGFRIVEPKNLRVDMNVLRAFVQQMGGLRIERFISGGAPIAPEAFSEDVVLEVEGVLGKDKLTVMNVTGADPTGRRHYLARLEKRNIMFEVLPSGLANLMKMAKGLRARHLVTMTEAQIQRIELEPHGGPKVVLVGGSARGFRMTEPFSGPTASTPVSELLFAIAHMDARQFVDDIPATAGVGNDDEFFTLRVGASPRATDMTVVRFGRSSLDGTVFARRADEATGVKLAADSVAKIRRSWLDYVSRQVVKASGDAFSVEVRRPDGKSLFYEKGEDMKWFGKNGAPGKPQDLSVLCRNVRNLRAQDVLAESALSPKAQPVDVIIRRDRPQNSSILLPFKLYPYDVAKDDGKVARYTVIPGPKDSKVLYLLEDSVYRDLYDSWTK